MGAKPYPGKNGKGNNSGNTKGTQRPTKGGHGTKNK